MIGPSTSRRLSLVVATYGRPEPLNELLRECADLDRPPDEVLIVDQVHERLGWSEIAPVILRRYSEKNIQVRLLRLDELNLPLARNVGTLFASGNIVLFLDDDIVLESEIVNGHLSGYTHSATVSVAGRILQDTSWPRSTEDGAPVPYGLGGNISFMRSALMSIGGFDARFSPCSKGEEIDVCYRARATGGEIRYVAAAAVRHLALPGGEKSRVGTFGYHESFVRNMTLLALRKYGAAGALTLPKHIEWMRTKDNAAASFKGWRRALMEWRGDKPFLNRLDLGEATVEEIFPSPAQGG